MLAAVEKIDQLNADQVAAAKAGDTQRLVAATDSLRDSDRARTSDCGGGRGEMRGSAHGLGGEREQRHSLLASECFPGRQDPRTWSGFSPRRL